MKRAITCLILSLAVAAAFSRCSEPFEFETGGEHDRVVIFCVLTDSLRQQSIEVYRTRPFLDGGISAPIFDAQVTITMGSSDKVYYTNMSARTRSYLTTEPFGCQEGETYKLEVRLDSNVDGMEEYYHATTTVLPQVQISKLRVVPLSLGVGDVTPYKVSIDGEDPEGPNAYVHRLRVNGQMRGDFNQWIYGDDALFDGERYEDYPLVMLANEPGEDEWIRTGSPVQLFTSTVEPDFATFISEVFGSEGGEMPLFGGPPYNVRTNFEGGALGWFGNLPANWPSNAVVE